MKTPTAAEAVRVLLHAAGLEPGEEEVAALVAAYPTVREAADALFRVPLDPGDEPQTVFRPDL